MAGQSILKQSFSALVTTAVRSVFEATRIPPFLPFHSRASAFRRKQETLHQPHRRRIIALLSSTNCKPNPNLITKVLD